MYSKMKMLWLIGVTSLVVGCSSTPEDQQTSSNVSDPFEGFNRVMWDFNYDYVDPYVLRPVSLAYVHYTPSPLRTGIINVLSNLDEPASMVNNLIMGNGEKAMQHFTRFWMNTTFGIFGLFDFATAAGISKDDDKSFSDALGHYGVGNGPYIMLPGVGPYTTREFTDVVDDTYLPLSLLNFWAGLGKWAFEGMESRAQLVSQEGQLANSPDSYILIRDSFIQRKDFKAEIKLDATENEAEESYLDDYLDSDDF